VKEKKMFRKLTEVWATPRVEELAAFELREAQKSLLESQSNLEYSTAMVDYHAKRVSRLTTFLRVENDRV
jgi:hypothetical protein